MEVKGRIGDSLSVCGYDDVRDLPDGLYSVGGFLYDIIIINGDVRLYYNMSSECISTLTDDDWKGYSFIAIIQPLTLTFNPQGN